MSLILLKTFHYLAILFAGGLLVGGGLIQAVYALSLIHISEPTRLLSISYAVFCLKKKKMKLSNIGKETSTIKP